MMVESYPCPFVNISWRKQLVHSTIVTPRQKRDSHLTCHISKLPYKCRCEGALVSRTFRDPKRSPVLPLVSLITHLTQCRSPEKASGRCEQSDTCAARQCSENLYNCLRDPSLSLT